MEHAFFMTWLLGFATALAFLAYALTRTSTPPPADRTVALFATAIVFALAAAWPLLLAVVLYVLFVESRD